MNDFQGTKNILIKNQINGSQLLAQNIALALNESKWVDIDLKIRFCILLMRKILEYQLEKSDTVFMIQKIKRKPLRFTIRLLKRYPEKGLSILLNSIMEELQGNQNYKLEQLVEFNNALLDLLFPAKPS